MSASDPPRLMSYGGELRSVLRDALEAEEHAAKAGSDVDAARLARIEARLALATAADATAPRAPEAPPSPAVSAASSTKGLWLTVATVAVAGAAILALGRGSRDDAPTRAPTSRPTSVVVAEHVTLAPPSAAPVERAPSAVADLPSAPAPARAAPARAAATTPSAEREIALVARAQDALHGDPARALALSDEHASTYPAGAFGQEREAVAIEALVALGRRAEAERRLSAFVARHPTSSHRVHLESLLAPPSAR